jgi:cytochrome c-type biogenesis protein CcmH/NrfG
VEQATLARRTDPSRAEWAVLAGDAQRAAGRLEGALEAYVEAVRLSPFDVGLLLKRASLYAQMRLFSSAAEDYRQALRSRPGDREVILGLARALADANDRPGARRVLEEYLRANPSDGEAASIRDWLMR